METEIKQEIKEIYDYLKDITEIQNTTLKTNSELVKSIKSIDKRIDFLEKKIIGNNNN